MLINLTEAECCGCARESFLSAAAEKKAKKKEKELAKKAKFTIAGGAEVVPETARAPLASPNN